MCGIYGMCSLDGSPLRSAETLASMSRALRHRGPDSHGQYRRRDLALGCERLRIVDLGDRGDQPFQDPQARCRLVCNGEIYNAAELRERYPSYPFRSRSDVEAILPLYLDKGFRGLADLDGMFALAIWDELSRSLVLARDRAGEKPLFYSRLEGEIWFASEVQALLSDPACSRELDGEAVRRFLQLGYVPEPRTAFRDVRKIEAGTFTRFTAHGYDVERYWLGAGGNGSGAGTVIPRGREVAASSEESELRSLLVRAVRKQLTADVPVGVFLSGGMDSSLVAAIAAAETPDRRLDTFTARFVEDSFDESLAAAAWAGRIGARHREILIDEEALEEALGQVIDRLAEPLADPAILPTYLVAREARRHVTAVLSGEGADELFGGYPTYVGHRVAAYYRRLPGTVRTGVRRSVDLLPSSRRKVTLEFLLKRFVAEAEKPWLERHLAWFGTGAAGLLAGDPDPPADGLGLVPADLTAHDGLGPMLLDYRTYLRDGLLVKNDRATMLHSLEARAPFLDRDLSSFALALPARWKVRGLTSKWLLKRAAREWLPRAIVHRRKRGLSVPVASWLDHGLRGEVDRLLDPAGLARQELFDPGRVRRLLGEHRSGHANHARPLWAVVILQRWLERWAPDRAI